MRQATHQIFVETRGAGLLDVTDAVSSWVGSQGFVEGLLTVFIAHTSASLVIQENADPDVLADLQDFFAKLAPESQSYRHSAEGPDDMPAHIKSALTATQLSIPIVKGRLSLGTWQGIYVFEHRARPHQRKLILHMLGE